MSTTAPVLSTFQDESNFEFEKYEKKQQDRGYLNPDWKDETHLFENLKNYYSINELADHLSQRDDQNSPKFKKITLQFPDSLVADSAIVSQLLSEALRKYQIDVQPKAESQTEKKHTQERSLSISCSGCECSDCNCSDKFDSKEGLNEQEVWILADTAYSACCIDEVAAEHVGGDVVVHLGDACLNAIQKLNAVYVFGKPYLDIELVVKQFKETYPATDSKVVLMADAPNSRYLSELYSKLKQSYKEIAYLDISLEKAHNSKIIDHSPTIFTSSNTIRISNRLLISDSKLEEDELINYSLFHITEPQPPHLLYLSTKFASISLYDPSSNTINQGPFPSLMKRYRYMHIARTAGTIGILVNTLSLRNTSLIINEVSKNIKEAAKKYYMFVVGKPNVAKLANFESIDCWCILGCGQGGIIVDTNNEFYKPIITPYELEMSLNPTVSWTGKWDVDFENLLNVQENNENQESLISEDNDGNSPTLEGEDEAPEFDPVTGKYISTSRPLRNIHHLEIESTSNNEENQLVKKFSTTVAIKGTVSTSATYLQNRKWTGLGSDFLNDEEYDEEGALVEEGRGGVARSYDFDVKDQQSK
ncbi:hypothetical protein WICMUC_001876 [Wickerhamomyces mucosus]|uniref:2-(3-amino-3-carboxypropyl)histidine synthase subunit 2 n=1 Tax=Wickerhamomyces mucosus TaxID=1378264 RepID=A0A9P8TG40_9ASCO|nr:hypothetical protein WICMUC_001876 [Wickerhamomyces mucosus]